MNSVSRTLVTLGAALALNLAPTLAGLDLAAARSTPAKTTHKARTSHEGEGAYVPPPAPEVTTTTTVATTVPAATAAPTPALPEQAQAMVGCWTGTAFQQAAGQQETWVINRRPDGTFSITFWALEGPDADTDMDGDGVPDAYAGIPAGSVYSPEGQTEAGQWSLDDGKETLVTTAINGAPQPGAARDVYQITRFTGQEIDYTHLATGQPFNTRRVDCGYRPPGLDGA